MGKVKPHSEKSSVYLSTRLGSNSWARYPDTIEKWRTGDFLGVRPVTLEFAPTLQCNFCCTECPYLVARKGSHVRRVKRAHYALENEYTASIEVATTVLERSKEAGVRCALWTGGGEPTLWRQLPIAVRISAQLGLSNALYTNGTVLGRNLSLTEQLLAPESRMAVCRVSINAVSEQVARRFSGARPEDVKNQLAGLGALLSMRTKLVPDYQKKSQQLPAVQVSTIVDERNVADLPAICAAVAQTFTDFGGAMGSDDDFVVRPLTKHSRPEYALQDHSKDVIIGILTACGTNGTERSKIESVGMNLHLGFGLDQVDAGLYSSYEESMRSEYSARDYCWASGLFLTVAYDGTVHLCVDRNCYKEWAIGNLMHQNVEDVLSGPRRIALLARVHGYKCGPQTCPATCRVPRLNKLARMIRSGELTAREITEISEYSMSQVPLLLG